MHFFYLLDLGPVCELPSLCATYCQVALESAFYMPAAMCQAAQNMVCCACADLCAALRQVLKELGMQLHPVEETFADMARTLIALGIAKPVKA